MDAGIGIHRREVEKIGFLKSACSKRRIKRTESAKVSGVLLQRRH